jgi:hypothetical protein
MNNVWKKYLKSQHDLLQFFEHYFRFLAKKQDQGLQAELKMSHNTYFNS